MLFRAAADPQRQGLLGTYSRGLKGALPLPEAATDPQRQQLHSMLMRGMKESYATLQPYTLPCNRHPALQPYTLPCNRTPSLATNRHPTLGQGGFKMAQNLDEMYFVIGPQHLRCRVPTVPTAPTVPTKTRLESSTKGS